MKNEKKDPAVEKLLVEYAHKFREDPLGFTEFCFPEFITRAWQEDILSTIGRNLKNSPVQVAVASGHGIGKTALVAMVEHWARVTCPDCKIVMTANTESQLRTKTWSEVSKWHSKSPYAHWFNLTATGIFHLGDREKTWRTDAIPWSETNSEAFAGLHNQGKRIVVILDEASAVADCIWEVIHGALTDQDTEIIFLALGNPTRNTGKFRACFAQQAHRWITRQIDARTVPGTNAKLFQEWKEDFGEDSDFFKVRVRGMFPSQASNQFISSEAVDACFKLKLEPGAYEHMPIVLACDVARFGDDSTVIMWRQGRKVFPAKVFKGLDTMQTADQIHHYAEKLKPAQIVVDSVGIGAGVVDRLRQFGYRRELIEYNGGRKPFDPTAYLNARSENWGKMRDAINASIDLDFDPQLREELIGIAYQFTNTNQIQLERKEHMKDRIGCSPDRADALSMLYSQPIKVEAKRAPLYIPTGSYGWMA